MVIHLRPVPEDVEFQPVSSGIFYNGKFVPATSGEVRLIQALYINMGHIVTNRRLAVLSQLSFSSMRVMVSRSRKAAHFMGYAIVQQYGEGYKMQKVGTPNG